MRSGMAKNLREHLKEHYFSESLATAQLTELHDLLRNDDTLDRSFKNQKVRLRFYVRMCSVAAILALAAIPFSYELGKHVGQSSVELPDAARREDGGRAIPNPVSVQLVAIKLHADWCNRCPLIAPIFDRIEREYGTRPVLFITLDLTDDVQRRQSEQLADALGVRWLLDREHRTGIIVLVDRTAKEILAVASEPDDWPLLASAIGDHLPD